MRTTTLLMLAALTAGACTPDAGIPQISGGQRGESEFSLLSTHADPFLVHRPDAFPGPTPIPAEACMREVWSDENIRETAAWQGAAGRQSPTALAALMRDTPRAAPLTAVAQILCSRPPRALAVIDLDGDGDLDVIAATTAEDNWYYLNDGSGVFERHVYDPLGQGRTPDLVEILRDGTQGYVESDSYVCDLDGDGVAEVVTVHSTDGAKLPITIQATGPEWPETPIKTVETAANIGSVGGFTCGDLDGDGLLDIVYTMRSTPLGHQERAGPIRILINGPEGLQDRSSEWVADQGRRSRSRAEVAGSSLWGILPFEPRLADLDGDGDLDLLVTADFGAPLLYENTGGKMQRRPAPLLQHYNTMGISAIDMNQDGRLDLLITDIDLRDQSTCPWSITCSEASQSPSGHAILLQQEDMRLARDTTSPEAVSFLYNGWGWGFVTADMNGDGRWDIIQAGGELGVASENSISWPYRAQPPAVLLGTTAGFTNVTRAWADTWALPNGSLTVTVADMNGDGSPDLLIYGEAVGRPQLYENLTPPDSFAQLSISAPGTVHVTHPDGRTETFRLPDRNGSFSVTSTSPWFLGLPEGPAEVEVRFDSGEEQKLVMIGGESRMVTP